MAVVRRRRETIDALEHALQGVKTSEVHPIVSQRDAPGIIGMRSVVEIDVPDDPPVEREVLVVMPPLPTRRRT